MSRFTASLVSGEFPISLEITPPRGGQRDILLRRAGMLAGLASAVNVIQRPDRMSSLDACAELIEAGALPFWHIANRGATRAGLGAQIELAAEAGIDLVLCLRGDHGGPDGESTPTIRECVGLAREGIPGALVGVTANQYGPRERVLRNLLPKIEAGARLVQTQPVFHLATALELAAEVGQRAPSAAWMPILMPVVSLADAEAVRKRLGIPIPGALLEGLGTEGAEAGWRFFANVLSGLRASGLVDGVAVMTLRMDPDPRFLARLHAELRAPCQTGAPESGESPS